MSTCMMVGTLCIDPLRRCPKGRTEPAPCCAQCDTTCPFICDDFLKRAGYEYRPDIVAKKKTRLN